MIPESVDHHSRWTRRATYNPAVAIDPIPADETAMDRTASREHAPVERLIDAGAVRLGALDYGNPDGPPVLLTHGVADSAWSLDPLARALADAYHVISLDLRGHGRSDWGAYTLPHLVGDLVGACETLDLQSPILIGHSLGGQAVAQFCGLYPDLPRAAVLIEAIGPPPRTLERVDPPRYEREWTRMRVDLIRRPARHRRQPDLASAIARFQEANPLLDRERAAFIVEKNTRAAEGGGRIWRHDPKVRDWLAGHDHGRAEQRWQGITCPVQVVLGSHAWEWFWSRSRVLSDDLEGPMSAEEIGRRMANFADARLTTVAGAGHMVHYDQPHELSRVVSDFLAEVAPADDPDQALA